MTPVILRGLHRLFCLVPIVGIAACGTQSAAQTAGSRPDAARAALAILASLEKSDVGAAALRHEDTRKRFAATAESLPQSVQQRVWNDKFVPEFRERIRYDQVGFALIGSPTISVIETRSSRDEYRRTVHDVFLQLDYASVERSSLIGAKGALLKKTGLRLQLVEDANGGLLWRSWALIPEMDESWKAGDILVACAVDMQLSPGSSHFTCLRSNSDPLRQAYLESAGTRFNAESDTQGVFKGTATQLFDVFRITMVSTSAYSEAMQARYSWARRNKMSLYWWDLYIREPWFSELWSRDGYSLFAERSKGSFLDSVAKVLGTGLRDTTPTSRMAVRSSGQIAADSERLWRLVAAGVSIDGVEHHDNKLFPFRMTLTASDPEQRLVAGSNVWGASTSANAVSGSMRDGSIYLSEAATFEDKTKGTLNYIIEPSGDTLAGTWTNLANGATGRLELTARDATESSRRQAEEVTAARVAREAEQRAAEAAAQASRDAALRAQESARALRPLVSPQGDPVRTILDLFDAFVAGDDEGVKRLMSAQGLRNASQFCSGNASTCLKGNYANAGSLESRSVEIGSQMSEQAEVRLRSVWRVPGRPSTEKRCQTYRLSLVESGWWVDYFGNAARCAF